MCFLESQTSIVPIQIRAEAGPKKLVFPDGEDLKISLLSHESVECELLIGEEEEEESHGLCEFTYARFLAPAKNVVSCSLNTGSSFLLQLQCPEACPEPVPPPTEPYCKSTKTLQAVDVGKTQNAYSSARDSCVL